MSITPVHVGNLLYGGRTLAGHIEAGERIAGWPEIAADSFRATEPGYFAPVEPAQQLPGVWGP